METYKRQFLDNLALSQERIRVHLRICEKANVLNKIPEFLNKINNHFGALIQFIHEHKLSHNHYRIFDDDINRLLSLLPTHLESLDKETVMPNGLKENIISHFERYTPTLDNILESMEFNFDFFKKVNFFESNIVAVGANGSGKTTLSNSLKKYLPPSGVVISAQKILVIPTFNSVSNPDMTVKKLENSQRIDKSLRTTYNTVHGGSQTVIGQLSDEFYILIDHLLAERSATRNKFVSALEKTNTFTEIPNSNLDKVLQIWNSLIQHRRIECEDGINLTLTVLDAENEVQYPAYQMSDGEKVVLYHIAQVIQAPTDGFIIIDEPEIYLHKTILNKLWDRLEGERSDCIFIYLTHDLDFAVTRTTAKKLWIKSYRHPDKWEIAPIPENIVPEPLLLELLGSRKNILFCEGTKGSIDEKIYNLLFTDYTVTPVESCFDVINYTKAFNKIPNIPVKAKGIIDSDYHTSERLAALKEKNVYSLAMSEVENLLLDEDFIKALASTILSNDNVVSLIKDDILDNLHSNIELQASNYVSTKINYYYNDSHMAKGNNVEAIMTNYDSFLKEIKIIDWHTERTEALKKIVIKRDYLGALSIFNNKGLKRIANNHLKITDFTDRAIRLLQTDQNAKNILIKYFPEELINTNPSSSI